MSACIGQQFWLADKRKSPLATSQASRAFKEGILFMAGVYRAKATRVEAEIISKRFAICGCNPRQEAPFAFAMEALLQRQAAEP